MHHFWKHWKFKSLESQVELMGSSLTAMYNEKNMLHSNLNRDISNKNEEKNEMVDIPDLPLDQLEEAMASESKDLSVQDTSGGSVVFGIIGAGQGGRKIS